MLLAGLAFTAKCAQPPCEFAASSNADGVSCGLRVTSTQPHTPSQFFAPVGFHLVIASRAAVVAHATPGHHPLLAIVWTLVKVDELTPTANNGYDFGTQFVHPSLSGSHVARIQVTGTASLDESPNRLVLRFRQRTPQASRYRGTLYIWTIRYLAYSLCFRQADYEQDTNVPQESTELFLSKYRAPSANAWCYTSLYGTDSTFGVPQRANV
jgi:hypothetical protein